MAFDPRDFTFSVDLKTQAVNQVEFLDATDKIQELKKAHILARSVYRYEKYWLPLAATFPEECLSAPLDIEWVWHCHMLSPRAYSKDCVQIVNTVVNHTIRSPKDYQRALAKSRDLWYRLYQEVGEPFTLDFCAPYNVNEVSCFKSKISYNIVEAATRQKVFYYQVSLPHYKDTKFLDDSIIRYKKFLFLKQQLPDEFIVPCYDIDLLWHAHQLNPWAYKHDMMKYIGNLFNHDDNVTDRSKGSKLNNADTKTREHWKRVFNEGFSLFGAMYRGFPQEGFLYQISQDDAYTFATKKSSIHLEKMSLQCSGRQTLNKIKLKVLGGAGEKHGSKLVWFEKKSGTDIVWRREELAKSGTFEFDTRNYNNIVFILQERKGLLFFKSEEKIGEASYNLLPVIEDLSRKSGGALEININLSNEVKLNVGGRYTGPVKGSALLFLEQGKYETAIIPENIQTLWGPVALERLPDGKDNHCQVASHRYTVIICL